VAIDGPYVTATTSVSDRRLECTGEATNVEVLDGALEVEVALCCTRQTGAVAVEGSAVFRVPVARV